MAELPLDQAVPRFKANEDRLDTFVNSATGYTTSGGTSVQSIQQFLASIGSNGIDFVDNAKARFGTGNDLEIYHSGSGSFIRDTGTGDLTIDGSAISIQTASAERVSVSASGIDVTGTVEFDGLSGTGAVTITDIADEDNMASNSATKLATQQSIKAYVDAQVGTADTLSEVLGLGNTTGGTDIAVSANDDITFTDSSKAIFGAGSDLQIFHDASHSYIKDSGTGNLKLETTGGNISLLGGTENMVVATKDGSVSAYHNGSKKLETTSTGIDVTGNIVGDGLTIAGDATFTGGGTGSIVINDEDSSLCPTMTFTRNGGGTTTNDFIKFENSGGEVATINSTGGAFLSALNVTGTVEFDGLSGTGSVTVTDILDEDDMTSDSATALATQQSIKAYVDANAGGGGLPTTGGTMTGTLNMGAQIIDNVEDIYLKDRLVHHGDSNNYFEFDTDIQYFVTNGSEKMRIDSGGIDVTGAIDVATSGASNTSKGLAIATSGTNFESDGGIISIDHAASGAVTGGYFSKYSAGGTLRHSIKGDGKGYFAGGIDVTGKIAVGDANTVADHELHIQSSSPTIRLEDTDGNKRFDITQSGDDTNFDFESNVIYKKADGTEVARIDTSGIDVTGNIEFDGLSGTGSVTVTDILDEDDMTSDSATALATQQSIKAYVDANAGGGGLPTTGGTMTGDILFNDGSKAIFGSGSDLKIFHDGANSYINELGAGDLVLQTNGAKIGLASASPFEWLLEAVPNNAVTLYYDGSTKLATTSTGIDVTGDINSTKSGGSTLTLENSITSISANELIGGIDFKGNDTSEDGNEVLAFIRAHALDTTPDSYIAFGTLQNNGGVDDVVTERMRLDNYGRLGIGTTGPSSLLHLASTAPYITFEDTDNNQDWQIQATAWFAIRDQTANAERMRIDSSGNVGIATSAPSTKIEVNGDIGIGRVAGAYTFREVVGGSERAGMHSNASNELIFKTGAATERMRLTSSGIDVTGDIDLPDNGKLLLGASDDLQIYHDGSHSYIKDSGSGNLKLETTGGNISLLGGTENMVVATKDGSVSAYHNGNKKLETTANGIQVTNVTNISMDASANGHFKVQGSGYGFAIALDADAANLYTNSSGRDLVFGVDETEVARVKPAGLDVTGKGTYTGAGSFEALELKTTDANRVYVTGNSTTSGDMWRLGTSTSNANLNIDALQSNGEILLRTGGTTERMRINSGGIDVTGGIDVANGTTYTTTGDFLAKVQQNSNATGKNGLSVMNAWASNTSTIFEAAMGWDGSASGYYPVFTIDGLGKTTWKDNFGNVRATIDGSGLDVNGSNDTVGASNTRQWSVGTAGAKMGVYALDNGTMYMRVESGSSTNFQFGTYDNIPIYTITNNTVRTTLLGNGNFGVGTTAPKTKTQITSGGTLNAPSLGSSSSNAPLYLTNNDTNYGLVVGNSSADGHVWLQAQRTDGTATAYNMTLNEAGGNVGIGTSAPTAKLSVAGDLTVSSTIEVGSLTPAQDGAIEVGVLAFGTPAIASTTDSTLLRSHIIFDNPNGVVGKINTIGSGTSYVTSSDYRLKTDVQAMTGSIDRLKALRPVNFEWIVDGTRIDGFLAHEAQEVVPEAVDGEKDAMRDQQYVESEATGDIYTPAVEATYETIQVELTPAVEAVYETVTVEISPAVEATYDEDGNELTPAIEAVTEEQEQLVTPAVDATYEEQQQELTPAVDEVIHSSDVVEPDELEEGQLWRETTEKVMATRQVPDYQGIDQSKIVPLLTSALQDAIAKIEALETRLEALES